MQGARGDRGADIRAARAGDGGQPPPKTGSLTQVGHEPLMNRGMNAALAVNGDYVYVGSRTDGGHEGMPHGGVMIVDVSDPSDPTLLGPPFDAKPGESSRELRVWRSQDVLIVLNTNCGVGDTLHHCTAPSISNFRFYDISGANATDPQLLTQLNVNTHEFFLWEDPNDPERALIFAGNANPNPTCGTTRRRADVSARGVGHLRRPGRERAGQPLRRVRRTARLHAVPGGARPGRDSNRRAALALDQQRRHAGPTTRC